jgi:hypothetical protein
VPVNISIRDKIGENRAVGEQEFLAGKFMAPGARRLRRFNARTPLTNADFTGEGR